MLGMLILTIPDTLYLRLSDNNPTSWHQIEVDSLLEWQLCRNKVKVMLHIGTKDIHRRQEVDKEGSNVMILQNRC